MTDEPVNLIAFAPDASDHGHPLGPGKILAGYRPCGCPGAIKAGKRGHQTVRCLECDLAGVEQIWFSPDHVDDSAPDLDDPGLN